MTPHDRPAPRPALRMAALGAHATLGAAVAWLALTAATSMTVRGIVCAVALAPLLATLRGLAYGRRKTAQWLALLLVAYVGGTTVEVVATSGTTAAASVALLAAVTELGLVLALIRQSPGPTRASGG